MLKIPHGFNLKSALGKNSAVISTITVDTMVALSNAKKAVFSR